MVKDVSSSACLHKYVNLEGTCSNITSELALPGPSCSIEQEQEEDQEDDQEDDQEGGRKRRRSDSFCLTFDDSLSWCVIGGLRNDTDCQGQSPDTHSTVSTPLLPVCLSLTLSVSICVRVLLSGTDLDCVCVCVCR